MVMVFFILLNYGDFLLTKIGCFRLTLFGDFLLTLTSLNQEQIKNLQYTVHNGHHPDGMKNLAEELWLTQYLIELSIHHI